ncbi:HAD family phosphatase [Marivita sp. XM-24bin2]|jgi:epoxide hydrolase-like predicted phosphatase|uniref:HAD family hydrolase n=1 Tax=unclassified Marivita TaxID=2632480 RepID=UPI000D7AA1F1|nr:HAD family phosphatase [Marivita sp. XM-24bin2]MCR9108824.1 HAD family phosphatase [Paracoccaceae bacterium]PWL34034.1 MAG: HAD family phosphatase [Marivita sp. XM-24bin2]
MATKHVVFDIGGVLVDWKPHLAWQEKFGSAEAAHAFIERTNFRALNTRADGGERFADLAKQIEDPEDRAHFEDYVRLYALTVTDPIPGTWDLLDRLKARGTPLHAITNWSAETWDEGLKSQPRLGQVFETLVVSGREGLTKPDPRIFQVFLARADVDPGACVFIDDSRKNVEGACALGMDGIHFTTASDLENELDDRGLL